MHEEHAFLARVWLLAFSYTLINCTRKLYSSKFYDTHIIVTDIMNTRNDSAAKFKNLAMGMLFDLFIDQNLKHAMYLEVHNITYAKHYMYSIQSYCLHAHIHIHNYTFTY